jgi:predicted phosphate transport protein (TIGR00153 family)
VRFRITPRDESFFDLLAASAQNLVAGVDLLKAFVTANGEREEYAEKLKALEHEGDMHTSRLVHKLNASFITPFDHEDIYRLAVSLDDVMDNMEAAADHVVLYRLGELPEGIVQQVDLLAEATQLTAQAMPELRKVRDLEPYWNEIDRIESQADRVHRRLLAKLFSGEYEALEVLKLKEVVDELEDASNALERVAKIVQGLAVKES